MKHLLSILFPATLALVCWNCGQNPAPGTVTTAQAIPVRNVQLLTHKELADSMLMDSTAALKPLTYKKLAPAAAKALLAENHIEKMILSDAPDNGFYGDDHYRIEFILTEMKPLPNNPLIYQVKGKNRYKKTISAFAGLLEIKSVAEFKDDNIDTTDVGFGEEDMNFGKGYTLQGQFNFKEDSTMSSSGQFTGNFTMEFYTALDKNDPNMGGDPQLWFCSSNSPSQGSGFRFIGNWTGFKNPAVKKPVIWSRDIFRFANDVLADFYYGERDVTINPKYRSLGWDTYWSGEEWWADSPKSAK